MPQGRREKLGFGALLEQQHAADRPSAVAANPFQANLRRAPDVRRGIGRHGHGLQQLHQRCLFFERCFGAPPLADVPDEGIEDIAILGAARPDHQLDGELMPIPMQSVDLDAAIGYVRLAGLLEAPDTLGMGLALLRRNDDLRQLASDNFRRAPAERDLGLMVPGGNRALAVHADERVHGGFDDLPVVLAAFPQLLFDAFQVGDVASHAGDACDLPARVEDWHFGGGNPARSAVRLAEIIDAIEQRLARTHDLLLVCEGPVGILGVKKIRGPPAQARVGVLDAQGAGVLPVDAGVPRIGILEKDQVRDTVHQHPQQRALPVNGLYQPVMHQGGAHQRLQFLGLPWLRHISKDLAAIDRILQRRDVGISGNQDAGSGRNVFDLLQKLVTGEPWHALVGQHDGHFVVAHHLHGCHRIVGGQDVVIVFKQILERRQNARLVIQDQQRLFMCPIHLPSAIAGPGESGP